MLVELGVGVKGLYGRSSISSPGRPSWRQRRQGKEEGWVTGLMRAGWLVSGVRGVGSAVNLSILDVWGSRGWWMLGLDIGGGG